MRWCSVHNQKMVDGGKQKSAAVFILMKELFQCRLPPSFGVHPQKCVLHWWQGTQEFSLFCTWLTIRIKIFVDCWSVQCLSSVMGWRCNLLYRSRFYVCASALCSLYGRICYIEACYIKVLFHAFCCNYGCDIGYCSLHQGLR